ncbi:hypothetical protein ACROYT_G017082 [Oculina patagonica]
MEVEKSTLHVTLLSSEWRSSTSGDVSTINRELAIQLAKHPNVQVSVFLPQCSEEDKNIAAHHKVQLIEAEKMTGVDPVDWLINIPENHAMDCILGHGVQLGRQIPLIQRNHDCKWIQVVHSAPEELGMYKSNSDAIPRGEELQQTEIQLCERADQVVAVGPKLADAYKRYLRPAKNPQNVLDLTPSIFTEFLDVKQATQERNTFCVLVIGSGDSEDFNLKGYDLAAQAIAELKEKSYQLRFVCAPGGKGEEIAENLLKHGVARNQLIVRSFNESREILAKLFCEVDLAIMPSRTEGFGLTALEALSAGLPVLVSGNSGLGEALKKVPTGSNCVVDSEDPKDWAKGIRAVRQKDREVRLAESKYLCEKYLEKYSWQEPCGVLLEKMQQLTFGSSQSNSTSTEMGKRPLPLADTQPAKRLREELADHDHHRGSSGWLPSSTEYSQSPFAAVSQTHEGPSYQRRHHDTQSSSGHDRPSSSMEYHQLPFTAASQTPTQTYQMSYTQVRHSQLPFPAATQHHGEPTYLRSHYAQSSPGWLPSSVGYSQFPPAVASQNHEEPSYQGRHTQNSSGHGRTSSLVDNNGLPFSAATQISFYVLSSVASPVDTFDVKTCQRKLAERYQRTAKVPTTVWSSVFQVELDQIYTRLSWVKEEQTLAGSSKKELSHYTELFTEKTKNGAVPKRILVQGETGIGKTTFVKKLLVDWSSLETAKRSGNEEQKDALRKFELVVSINLKEVSKCQTLREVISASHLFPEDEEKSIDDLLSYLDRNQEKVLVVFDGYDEYRTGSEAEEKYGSRSNSPIYKLFHGNILRDCTVLVTTRSSRADEIRGPADIQAEITGFNLSDRKDFMKKMLTSQAQVDELLQFLEKSKMEDLARVPLLNLFFCLLWKEGKEKLMELVESKTKLFRAITKHILQHSYKRHSPSHVSKLKEENYKEILAEIGKVALEGLLKGDLMFEFGQLPDKVRGEESVIVGLLQVSEYGPSLEPKEMVSFIHKSIQEYLAVWYIAYSCVHEGSLGGIEQHARTLEDCQALKNVFQFICGLSDDGAVQVFQHLTSVRKSDPTLDLSKTIPDGENETDVPLCDVTDRHRWFSDLVYDSFREVRSKAELLSHCFDCTCRVILVTRDRPISKLVPNVNVLTKLSRYCAFLFESIYFNNEDSVMYESLEFLNCLHVPLTIPDSSKILTVGDLLVKKVHCCLFSCCSFSSILCCRNGQFQFYVTKLHLWCDEPARLFTEFSTGSASSAAASLCSVQSCLKFLRSVHFSRLRSQTAKALASVIRNCKHLNRVEVRESDDSVCDLLEQLSNHKKCSLTIGSYSNLFGNVHLTSAGAVKLVSLLPLSNKIITLGLDLKDCCSQAVDTLVTSFTHTTLKGLALNGISLTSTAAAALGRSVPEMSYLQELVLTGVSGSILQAEEMVALLGRFNKTLCLSKLIFSGFSVTGCLVPLTKSFKFFPKLTELKLE